MLKKNDRIKIEGKLGVVKCVRAGKAEVVLDEWWSKEGGEWGYEVGRIAADNPHVQVVDDPMPDSVFPPGDPMAGYTVKVSGCFETHDGWAFQMGVLLNGKKLDVSIEQPGTGGDTYATGKDCAQLLDKCDEWVAFYGLPSTINSFQLWTDIAFGDYLAKTKDGVPANRPMDALLDPWRDDPLFKLLSA